MKRTGIMGLCLAVVFALTAMTASSALATPGSLEWGECVKKEEAASIYKNGGCTKKAGATLSEHKFEWHPLAVGHKFTSLLVAGSGNPTLENVAGEIISCTGQKEKQGEYSGPKTINHVIGEFSGCEGLKGKCNSETGETGEIFTYELKGEPGVVKKEVKEEKNQDGSDLIAEKDHLVKGVEEPVLAQFQCAKLPVTVRGGVLIKTAEGTKQLTNKMLTKVKVEFLAKEGKQIPREWIPAGKYEAGQTALEVDVLEGNLAEKGYVESGQSLITTQLANPKTQKTELRQCEKNIC
jgi:hypothetical protein